MNIFYLVGRYVFSVLPYLYNITNNATMYVLIFKILRTEIEQKNFQYFWYFPFQQFQIQVKKLTFFTSLNAKTSLPLVLPTFGTKYYLLQEEKWHLTITL